MIQKKKPTFFFCQIMTDSDHISMSLLVVLPVSTVLVVLPVQHPRCFGSRVDFDAFASALPMLLRRAQDGKSWNSPKIHIFI